MTTTQGNQNESLSSNEIVSTEDTEASEEVKI